MCYSSILIATRIFKREEIKTVERTIGIEYFTNKEYVYPFENNKFMIGISAYAHSISNNSCSLQQTNITLTNFAFKFYNNQTPSSFIIESIDLVECNKTHFPNLQSDGIYANKIFLWPSTDLRLQGSGTSFELEYFSYGIKFVPVDGCEQTFEEYLQDVDYINTSILLSNEILDPQNIDDPIQTVISDQNTMFIDPKQSTNKVLYLKK